MNITAINIFLLEIPFQTPFKHATAIREKTASLWVEVRSTEGVIGNGESCPRAYVTGETLGKAVWFVEGKKQMLMENIHDLDDLKDWVEMHRVDIDLNPAAWCAVELALLDSLAKDKQCSVEQLLGLPQLAQSYRYTAVLGDMEADKFETQTRQYLDMGFTDFKVKISGDIGLDKEKLSCLKRLSPKSSLRLDANNFWQELNQASRFLQKLDIDFFAVEEPLQANNYDDLAMLAKNLEKKIILDESFLRFEQFEWLQTAPETWLINLRISKMGGVIRSLEIVKKAQKIGVKLVVGAQVGETSLLTRAALNIADAAGDLLVGQEGAFGTYLLKEEVCEPLLMFGKGGKLRLPQGLSASPGFGMKLINRLFFQSLDDAVHTNIDRGLKQGEK